MKKLNIMALLLMGALLFTACDADRDDNPVIDLSKPQAPITLNTPIFAGGTYDLENTDSVLLTCTAPAGTDRKHRQPFLGGLHPRLITDNPLQRE